MPDAKRRERVDDRVVDGRRRADRPRLTDPLRTERVQRGRRLHLHGLPKWEVGGGGKRVADESPGQGIPVLVVDDLLVERLGDRKSTRLNSSHPSISYAVFCLKKKT